MPNAVMFDLDGTLTDTEGVWDEVRRRLAAEAGLEWREEYSRVMMGMSTPEWSRYLVEEVGLPVVPEEAARMTVQGMVDHYLSGAQPMPGAADAVRRMASRYPVAIVSSSPALLIETAAQVLDIGDALAAIVSTEECDRGKPAPDGYLLACTRLGVRPGDAVAVEDSQAGITSALNAGLTVVACPSTFRRPPESILERTTVVGSLDELTLELVEGLS